MIFIIIYYIFIVFIISVSLFIIIIMPFDRA